MGEQRLAEIEERMTGWTSCDRLDCRHDQCLPVRLLAEVRRLREELRESEQEADALWEQHSRG